MIELVVDDDALVADGKPRRYSCAVCGEGYHDIFHSAPKSDRCLRQLRIKAQVEAHSDDNADAVRTRLPPITSRPAPCLPTIAKRGLEDRRRHGEIAR